MSDFKNICMINKLIIRKIMVLSLLLMIYCYQFSKFFKSCVRWEFSFCELAVTHDNRFENDQQFVERNSSIAVQVEENVEN